MNRATADRSSAQIGKEEWVEFDGIRLKSLQVWTKYKRDAE